MARRKIAYTDILFRAVNEQESVRGTSIIVLENNSGNSNGNSETNTLHFTGSPTSNINCGAIHNASDKLWLSIWFKLDEDWEPGSGNAYLWGKRINAASQIYLRFNNAGGLTFYQNNLGNTFSIGVKENSVTKYSWDADTWYHIIASVSDTNKVRLILNGGIANTCSDDTAIPNEGNFIIGARLDPETVGGFIGVIRDVAVGTDDLSAAEEAGRFNGMVPTDATEYYKLNEGTGTIAINYGTSGNNGTIGTGCTWVTDQ